VISSDAVRIKKSPSPVKSIVIELYRNDYRRSILDTADGSTCEIVNCIIVRASGINSLYLIRREVTCRLTYTQHVTILNAMMQMNCELKIIIII
jgi:hypothetical protein